MFPDSTCIANGLRTNQDKMQRVCRMRVVCAVWESEPTESKPVESLTYNLSLMHMCVHTWAHTHPAPPPPLLQILGRPAFNLHLVVKAHHEASSLEAHNCKGHRALVTRPLMEILKSEPGKWTLIRILCLELTCVAVSVRAAASASPRCCTIL